MFLKTLFSDIFTETLIIHIVFIIDILFIIFIRLRYFKNKKILDNMKYFLADQYNSNLERNVYFFIPEQCDQQLPHSNNKNNRRVSNYNDSSSSPRNDQYHSNNNGPIAKRKISTYFCFLNPLRLIYGNNNNNNGLRESYKNENSHSDDSENNNNNNTISNVETSMPISQEMQRLKTVNNTNNNIVYNDDNSNTTKTKKKSKKKSKTSEDDEFKQQFQFENQDDEQNHADSIIEFREDIVSNGTKSLSISRQQRDRTAIHDLDSKQHSPTLTQSQKQRQSNDNRNENTNNNASLSSSLISPSFESTTTTTNSINNTSSAMPQQQSTHLSTTPNAFTKPIVRSLTLEEYLKTQLN